MIRNNVFPLNSLEYDPNLRGEAPVAQQLVDISGTLAAGEFEVDDVPSPFQSIANGDVFGAIVLSNTTTGGEVYSARVEQGTSGVGYLKITLCSSDVASTTATVAQALIVGRISPVQV